MDINNKGKIIVLSDPLCRPLSAIQKRQKSVSYTDKRKIFKVIEIPKCNFSYSSLFLNEKSFTSNSNSGTIFHNAFINRLNSRIEKKYFHKQNRFKCNFSQFNFENIFNNRQCFSKSSHSKIIDVIRLLNKKYTLNKLYNSKLFFENDIYKAFQFDSFERTINNNFSNLHKTHFLGFNNYKYWQNRQNILKNPRNKVYLNRSYDNNKCNSLSKKNPKFNQRKTKIDKCLKIMANEKRASVESKHLTLSQLPNNKNKNKSQLKNEASNNNRNSIVFIIPAHKAEIIN